MTLTEGMESVSRWGGEGITSNKCRINSIYNLCDVMEVRGR